MPLWIAEILADFCRWRARCATARAHRAIEACEGWLAIEEKIISITMNGVSNATEAETDYRK